MATTQGKKKVSVVLMIASGSVGALAAIPGLLPEKLHQPALGFVAVCAVVLANLPAWFGDAPAQHVVNDAAPPLPEVPPPPQPAAAPAPPTPPPVV